MGTTAAPDNGQAPVQIVPNQPAAPVKSAVAEASDRARADIAAGKTLGDAAPAGGQAPPARVPPVPAAGQQPPAPKPAEGQPAVPPANETAEQKQAREAAAATAAAAAAAAETPEQKQAREAAEALVVEIPMGDSDEETLVINAATPEMAENLREIIEIATSAQALTEEVESLRTTAQQTEELREYADADPIGFTLDMLGKNLDTAKALTMYLLTQPSLYAAVKDDLAKLADPKEFKILAGDARDARHTMTEQANERIETSRVVRQNLQDVQATVNAMLPTDLTPAQRQVAYRDCLRDLKDYADSKELVVLPVHQIPAVLANRLSALGIDPEEATARATAAAARKGGSTPTPRFPRASAAPTRTPPARPAAPAPKKDGAAFVASAARKKDVAGIPNGGAGSPSNTGGLSAPRDAEGKPLGIKATLEWHRAQRAKGVRNW
jgi:hypothetical protein